jgi:hypothetical protein
MLSHQRIDSGFMTYNPHKSPPPHSPEAARACALPKSSVCTCARPSARGHQRLHDISPSTNRLPPTLPPMATELPHGCLADSALMAASYSRRAEAWSTCDAAPESEAARACALTKSSVCTCARPSARGTITTSALTGGDRSCPSSTGTFLSDLLFSPDSAQDNAR